MIFFLIEIMILCLLGFFLTYLFVLSLLALTVKKQTTFQTKVEKKFAVIIPAHNEETTIRKTISSLSNMDYPHDKFDIIVVADNCSDTTAEKAKNLSAIVLERFEKTKRGKGQALQWAFELILNSSEHYDAFIVIDADSTVTRNFLHVMNWYCIQGYSSIQAADIVAANPGAWSSEVSRLSLALFNYARPLGRKAINCSSGLRGNGMCFSTETLKKVPWQAHSITEDLEYGIVLLLNGIQTVLAHEAIVYATMPSKSKNAESQRTRWESGRINVVRKYFYSLFVASIKNRSWKMFDMLIELITPAFTNMVGIVLLALAAKYSLWILGFSFALSAVSFWWLLLVISFLYVIVGLHASEADAVLFKAIFYFPRYIVWKVQLYVKVLLTGASKEWIRTTREEHK